jgi:serpin B
METNYQLAPMLADMGMTDAFSRRADFSGIASESLYIGWVLHKPYVDVDEGGTESAAVTVIGIMHPVVVMVEPPPMEFRADHPFIFLLRQKSSGAILFMGRVMKPKT